MFRKLLFAVIVGLISLLPATALHAQSKQDIDAIKVPVALILRGRVVASEDDTDGFQAKVAIEVLESGKGLKKGQIVSLEFVGYSPCNMSGVPRLGEDVTRLVVNGRGDHLFPHCGRTGFPHGDSGIALLMEFRDRWLELDAKANAEPQNLAAQMALGNHLARWGDERGALAAFQRALKLTPNNIALRLHIAALQINLLRPDPAGKILDTLPQSESIRGRVALMRLQITALANLERGREEARKKAESYQWNDLWVSAPTRFLTSQDVSGIELWRLDLTTMRAARSNWRQARLYASALRKADFTRADLSGARFLEIDLTGANLSSARAAKATITESVLTNVQANGFDGQEANFSGSNLSGANFRNANLRGANFNGADLSGTDFRNADLRDAKFGRVKVDCKTRFPKGFDTGRGQWIITDTCNGRYPLNFDGVDFVPSVFDNSKLINNALNAMSFVGRDLRGASFRKTHFGYSHTFRKSDIRQVDFSGTWFSSADFSNAQAQNVRMSDIYGEIDKLAGADFSGSVVSGRLDDRFLEWRKNYGVISDVDDEIERQAKLGDPSGITSALLGGNPLILGNWGGFPRMTGASIKNARITFPSWPGKDGNRENLLSFLEATIEHSTIDCTEPSPPDILGNSTLADISAGWGRYILTLDIARKIVARNPTSRPSNRCAKEIKTYLGGDCRAGQTKASFAYACPPAP